jgi:hypothetical protein
VQFSSRSCSLPSTATARPGPKRPNCASRWQKGVIRRAGPGCRVLECGAVVDGGSHRPQCPATGANS